MVRNGEIIIIIEKTITITEILITSLGTTVNTHDSKPTKKSEQKERDSKITLMHRSSYFIPAQFSNSFFRQFNLAMKLKKDELKKQGKVNAEVSEVTEENFIEAFDVTKDHMSKVAEILGKGENTKNSGDSSV